MTNKVTRKEVAKQFSIASQLLLEWIDQRGNSREKINNNLLHCVQSNLVLLSLLLRKVTIDLDENIIPGKSPRK